MTASAPEPLDDKFTSSGNPVIATEVRINERLALQAQSRSQPKN
jgi:hypothetical protein